MTSQDDLTRRYEAINDDLRRCIDYRLKNGGEGESLLSTNLYSRRC